MRRSGVFGAMLALSVPLGVLGGPRLFEPSTLALAEAVRALGPLSGFRCARSATYVYDPRRDSVDRTLLSEAPEEVIRSHFPDLQVERVEANLRDGDTVIWTRDETTRRVFVLSPGRLQSIGSGGAAICTAHLGAWQIVGDHALE